MLCPVSTTPRHRCLFALILSGWPLSVGLELCTLGDVINNVIVSLLGRGQVVHAHDHDVTHTVVQHVFLKRWSDSEGDISPKIRCMHTRRESYNSPLR